MLVTAVKTFEHNGIKKRGTVFEVSDVMAKALKRSKLFEDESPSNPSKAACILPSALPPAPVSQQTIAKQSENGEKKKRGRKKKV